MLIVVLLTLVQVELLIVIFVLLSRIRRLEKRQGPLEGICRTAADLYVIRKSGRHRLENEIAAERALYEAVERVLENLP